MIPDTLRDAVIKIEKYLEACSSHYPDNAEITLDIIAIKTHMDRVKALLDNIYDETRLDDSIYTAKE